jgi:hypothetical protein
MNVTARFDVLAVLAVSIALAGCDGERKRECDQFLATLKPIGEGAPTAAVIGRVREGLSAMAFGDKPLSEHAANVKRTLEVLDNGLTTLEGPSPPDGTDDLVKSKLKEALAERDDVARYCAP